MIDNSSTPHVLSLIFRTACVFLIALLFYIPPSQAQRPGHGNSAYGLTVQRNGALEILHRASRVSEVFRPEFYVLYSATDPKLHMSFVRELRYWVPAWTTAGKNVTDYFKAGEVRRVKLSQISREDNGITWTFKQRDSYELEAHLIVPEDGGMPVLKFSFKAQRPGWYSIGYAGAPSTSIDQAAAIWQPLVWQEKRFPKESFLTPEFACTLPAAFVSQNDHTWSVVAEPSEIPFRFVTNSNSRFGVAVRNAEGKAQPMLFAPVLGGESSKMNEGDTFSFQMRLYVAPGECYDAYKTIARDLFGFHDYRSNTICPLNETIGNMIAYAMNDVYAGWNADLKASDYATDVKNTVKTVSSLHPLSVAIVTDDEQVYRRRALPTIEFLMSREKYLFTSTEPVDTHQNPSNLLKGPAAEVSELAALQLISHGNNPVFEHYARALWSKPRALNLLVVSEGGSWQNALAMYRLTGDNAYLEKARNGADDYIAQRIDEPQKDFTDAHIPEGGQFWTDFTPKWIDLIELYESTRDKKYLDAAEKGARLFVDDIWMQPVFSGTQIKVNPGNKAPMHAYQNRLFKDPEPMTAPEQVIDAWTVAMTGLTSEASATYVNNRAIFLAHYAAYMLRLYYYTGDTFYRDIGRSAVVGRYSNYPGYFVSEYSNVFMREDYPYRSLSEATYNNFYYNHIWPNITLLMDYLITDAIVRSDGNIDFPSQYAQGYAYLQSKVYGDRPGTFYGDKDVQLWLPHHLLRADNIQANYVAGYGNDNLYLAFTNQSDSVEEVSVRINPSIVPFRHDRAYDVDVWKDNKRAGSTTMLDGVVRFSLSPKGITALRIHGIDVVPQFQQKLYHGPQDVSDKSFSEADTPVGKVTGMILSMGPALKDVYVWLPATQKELKSVTFHYNTGGEWHVATDDTYPYELSVSLKEDESRIEYWIEGVNLRDEKIKVDVVKLNAR